MTSPSAAAREEENAASAVKGAAVPALRIALPPPPQPTQQQRWTVSSDIAGLAEALSPRRQKQRPKETKKKKKQQRQTKSSKEEEEEAFAAPSPSEQQQQSEEKEDRASSSSSQQKQQRRRRSLFALLPRERDFGQTVRTPDWTAIAAESAVRHTYDARRMVWSHTRMVVRVDPHPFAVGGMRRAHFLVAEVAEEEDEYCDEEEEEEGSGRRRTRRKKKRSAKGKGKGRADPSTLPLLVAKFANDAALADAAAAAACDEDKEEQLRTLCAQNVEQQAIARFYAARYNKYRPPKPVDFLEAAMYELPGRRGADRFAGVEAYIMGHYQKWSNNFGYVAENTRNTPQAFSHFTYEASKHCLIIVDIQGVGELFTDPVIHTRDRSGAELFPGNLGLAGIEQFLLTHTCNPLCHALNLPPINAEPRRGDVADEQQQQQQQHGTMFAPPQGSPRRVEITRTSVAVHSMGRPPERVPADCDENDPLLGRSNGCCCSCCTLL